MFITHMGTIQHPTCHTAHIHLLLSLRMLGRQRMGPRLISATRTILQIIHRFTAHMHLGRVIFRHIIMDTKDVSWNWQRCITICLSKVKTHTWTNQLHRSQSAQGSKASPTSRNLTSSWKGEKIIEARSVDDCVNLSIATLRIYRPRKGTRH